MVAHWTRAQLIRRAQRKDGARFKAILDARLKFSDYHRTLKSWGIRKPRSARPTNNALINQVSRYGRYKLRSSKQVKATELINSSQDTKTGEEEQIRKRDRRELKLSRAVRDNDVNLRIFDSAPDGNREYTRTWREFDSMQRKKAWSCWATRIFHRRLPSNVVLVEEKKTAFMKTLAEKHHDLIYGNTKDAKSTKLRHPSNSKQDREFQHAVVTLKRSFMPAAMMELNENGHLLIDPFAGHANTCLTWSQTEYSSREKTTSRETWHLSEMLWNNTPSKQVLEQLEKSGHVYQMSQRRHNTCFNSLSHAYFSSLTTWKKENGCIHHMNFITSPPFKLSLLALLTCYKRASEFVCFLLPDHTFKMKGQTPKTKSQMAWYNRLLEQGRVAIIRSRTPFKLGECNELCWFVFFKKRSFRSKFLRQRGTQLNDLVVKFEGRYSGRNGVRLRR